VIVLIILVGSLLIFRVAGVFGVAAFSTWVAAMRWALAAMFLFTGIAHFTKAKYGMARMVPQVFGNAMAWVYFTGLCEIAGAVGLLLPRFRSLAGICLILLLIAMFPANAKAAIEHLKVAADFDWTFPAWIGLDWLGTPDSFPDNKIKFKPKTAGETHVLSEIGIPRPQERTRRTHAAD
jgi:uncharacterized membrane protein